jgi:hypothetical protein
VLRPVLALAAASALLCGGCSGDDSGDSDETGLRSALGRVAATDDTREYVEYGDVALLTKLAAGRDGRRYLNLVGYGFSPLAPTYRLMADELHFDPSKMDGAVVAGQPPNHAGVLWGDYDVDALERALADRDIPAETDGGGKRWKSADDRELDVDGPLTGIARTSELNDIRTAPGTFAYSSARAGLDAVSEPGGDTLADDPLMRRLSGCLGDAAAAVLTAPVEGDPIAYGVGVRLTLAGEATEVACLTPHGKPSELRDHIEQQLKDGKAPSTRQSWDELLPEAEVELVELGTVVRIEAKTGDGAPLGRVMQMLLTHDLAALAGS